MLLICFECGGPWPGLRVKSVTGTGPGRDGSCNRDATGTGTGTRTRLEPAAEAAADRIRQPCGQPVNNTPSPSPPFCPAVALSSNQPAVTLIQYRLYYSYLPGATMGSEAQDKKLVRIAGVGFNPHIHHRTHHHPRHQHHQPHTKRRVSSSSS